MMTFQITSNYRRPISTLLVYLSTDTFKTGPANIDALLGAFTDWVDFGEDLLPKVPVIEVGSAHQLAVGG